MPERTLRIDQVDACPCGTHALVQLVDTDGRLRARLRIGIEAGRSLAAFDAGLPDAMSAAVRAIDQSVRAVGATPVALQLSNADDRVEVSLWLTAADGRHVHTVIDPGIAMLAARVLELPIGVRPRGVPQERTPATPASAAPPLPEVYHALLEQLRWEDLA